MNCKIASLSYLLTLVISCNPGTHTTDTAVEWTTVNGVSIPVPPPVHPRLYLRPEHVSQLQGRIEHSVLKPVWERLQAQAENALMYRVELNALQYLMTGDRAAGRMAVEQTLELMRQDHWDPEQNVNQNSRVFGRVMTSAAMAYDWCHDVWRAEEKQAVIDAFIAGAQRFESGYPIKSGGSITSHLSEWMITRDMLSMGIAVYDEYPDMYNDAASRIIGAMIPARNWFYPGHAHHQGNSYGPMRFECEIYPLWIFNRLGVSGLYSPETRYVPYSWMYLRRPDGQLLRDGDNYNTYHPLGAAWPLGLGGIMISSYYGDPYVYDDFLRNPHLPDRDVIYQLLWQDPDLKPKPVAELPLSRYMGAPFGWMVARTGWDDNAAIAEMKVNIYNFMNHQHLDAGSFQVYYKGPLAIDSGEYQGQQSKYAGVHDQRYLKRTIAHNALLIYDPKESLPVWRNIPPWNDGGQRICNDWREPSSLDSMLNGDYKTGAVEAQGFGPDVQTPLYTYMKGDITEAYSSKVREVKRSFVFLNLRQTAVPAALVVFDRVIAADPSFKKYWLLHSMEKPRIAGDLVTVDRTERGGSGRLVNQVMLPSAENRTVKAIGGPGKEFFVFGENFPNDPDPERAHASEAGAWRVEVSPKKAAAEDVFLNVMQVMDVTQKEPLAISLIQSAELIGIQMADRMVLFNREAQKSAGPVTFTMDGEAPCWILVTDLAAGAWQVQRNGTAVGSVIQVTEEAGTLFVEQTPGTYTLTRQ